MNVHDRLNSALPSLSLPEERCGPQRGSQLKEPERALYRWILRSFAVSGCPSPDALANAARDVGVDDVEEALARMVDHDLIQRSISGAITRAYPFSAIPTNHVVTLDNGHRLYAMCAVDALGVPIMVGTGATVTTEDPVSGVDIAIHVGADGTGRPDPLTSVVLCAVATGAGPLSSVCCPLVNTFESQDSAGMFLAMHPEMDGPILTIPDAIACAAAVFGGVLG